MGHHRVRHQLSEYIDGSVTAEEKREIEEHLRTCPACGDALRELKKTIEHIKTAEEVEPPAWMTQQTMAKIRATAKKRQGFFHLLSLPLHVKLPIQAVAILFLAVTVFYIYRNIQPTAKYEETPTEQFSTGEKATIPGPESPEQQPSVTAKGELGKAKDFSLRSQKVPQTPEYKSLDMRQEYESPQAPVPAPAKPAEQPPQAARESALDKRAASPQTAAPAMVQQQTEPAAGSSQQVESKHEFVAPEQKTAELPDGAGKRGNFVKVIIERHPTGKPKLIMSYRIINSRKVRIAEERFNKDGERHGIQKEYYESGQLKTEAQYEYGKLDWYVEFQPDGVKKTGKSNFDWFWLKN